MKKIISIITGLLFFISCSTPYKAIGFTGGYSETQLDVNMYQVYFSGNGYTSSQSAANMCLLRCAELCIKGGYNYFIIVDQAHETNNSSYTTATRTQTSAKVDVYGNTAYGSSNSYTTGGQTYNISKPSSSNTIILLNEKPSEGVSYNANFLFNSLGKTYIKN